MEAIEKDKIGVIDVFDDSSLIPSVKDLAEGKDVRREELVRALVVHIRKSMQLGSGIIHLDPESTTTAGWIIKFLRSLIEKRWDMTIDERDDDGGETEDKAAADVQDMLNECGVSQAK